MKNFVCQFRVRSNTIHVQAVSSNKLAGRGHGRDYGFAIDLPLVSIHAKPEDATLDSLAGTEQKYFGGMLTIDPKTKAITIRACHQTYTWHVPELVSTLTN